MGDSALYANISRDMYLSGDLLNLYVNGTDWLDKPHFQYWWTALIMHVFGPHDWVFKLASFLFYLISLRYCFVFAKRHYGKEVAMTAIIILASAMHVIISNSDVRAETLLMAMIIAAVHHGVRWIREETWSQMIWAVLWSALAILTKGLFVLIPVVFGVFVFAWHQGYHKRVLNWRKLVALALLVIFISPELWCLYQQFDLHPEKLVYGERNVSGVWFFIWESQFGRFFNTGPITGSGYPLFFVQVMLWAFAPWSLFFYWAFAKMGWRMITGRRLMEVASLAGFISMFVVYSMSSFQLSHYLNILFPFAAVITAQQWINGNYPVWLKRVFCASLLMLYMVLIWGIIAFELAPLWQAIVFGFVALLAHGSIWQSGSLKKTKLLWHGSTAMIAFAIFLNLIFYPWLFQYQSGTTAAAIFNDHDQEIAQARNSFLLEFYTDRELLRIDTSMAFAPQLRSDEHLIYADQHILQKLDTRGEDYDIIDSLDHFHTTKVNIKFLKPQTRSGEAFHRYLIRMR